MILAVSGSTALWYLTRATGAVTLILLTISVGLGVANVQRWQTPELPRFVVDRIHRDASLLALALLAVHILTSLVDGFAPITLIDVFIPFTSAYRPIWLGLGTFASDLMIALVITSLARERIGYSTWRAIHWAAYASWPIAVVHGLGTGSDTKSAWMLLLTAACTAAVIAAVCVRACPAGRRTAACAPRRSAPRCSCRWASSCGCPVARSAPAGPSGPGRRRRCSRPLRGRRPGARAPRRAARRAASGSGGGQSGGATVSPFTAQGTGTVQQSQTASGLAQVEIKLALRARRSARWTSASRDSRRPAVGSR